MTQKAKATKKSKNPERLSCCQREVNRALAGIRTANVCLLDVKKDIEAALASLTSGMEAVEDLTDVYMALPKFTKAASELRLQLARVIRLGRMAEGRHADAEEYLKTHGEADVREQ